MAKLIEAVTARTRTLMVANMATKLAAIEADMADGVVLPDIAEYIDGERPATLWPACWILGQDSRLEIEEYQQLLFPLGYWRHSVAVVIAVMDPDSADTLRKRLHRYALAVTQVIRDAEGDGVEWIRAKVTDVSVMPVFQHTGNNQFRQDVHVFLEVDRVD